jgi:hypothetical protein
LIIAVKRIVFGCIMAPMAHPAIEWAKTHLIAESFKDHVPHRLLAEFIDRPYRERVNAGG